MEKTIHRSWTAYENFDCTFVISGYFAVLHQNHVIASSTYSKYFGVCEVDATVGGNCGAVSSFTISLLVCEELLFVLYSFVDFLNIVFKLGSFLLVEYSTFRFLKLVFGCASLLEIGLLETSYK